MLARRSEALVILGALAATLLLTAACDKKEDAPATPTVAASAIAAPPPPEGPKVLKLMIDPASKTSIEMPAPKEHITASTSAAKGELTVDPTDLTKTRGQVKVDLLTLKTTTFSDAKKDSSQTEHAHNWLEAGDLVTPEVKEANRWAIFNIQGVDGLAEKDLSKVPVTPGGKDDVRTVAATVKGDFFLHGHQVHKDVPVEIVFHYLTSQAATPGAKPTRVEVHTKTPLHVILADHDVK